ncbi:hypothetical protein BGW37DRAFT_475968 [Umbelopsis sp. PMI_123]|nr:hypothetical protein BGW37DRAFT_475968 [Umbelopsis sp. PMI_123]
MPKAQSHGRRVATRSRTSSKSRDTVANDENEQALSSSGDPTLAKHVDTSPGREHLRLDTTKSTTSTISDKLIPHDERMKVLEALDLNQSMQQEIMKQLSWIEDNIALNLQYMYEVRAMRWKEQRIKRSKSSYSHPHYRFPQFFTDDAGESPPVPNTPYESSSWQAYRYRPWNYAERQKLVEGIRVEAKRLMALDYHASGHHHLIWDVEKVSDERLEVYSVDRIDWKRVSKIHVPHRTPTECMIQWTTQEHPKINKTPWSVKENTKLVQLVLKHGIYGKWEKIAVELGTNRTVSQCFSHYQSQVSRQKAKRRWTKTEDRLLKQVVKSLGPRNWQQIAHIVGDRTGSQCLQRWTKALDPAIRRSRWAQEEDEVLKNAVEVYGLGNWRMVQKHIPGRTDMQCRERWVNILDPALDHSKLVAEETERLHKLVNEHGTKWSMLTQYFPGRTDNQLLRTWKNHSVEIEKGLCKLNQSEDSVQSDHDQHGNSEVGSTSASAPEEPQTPSASKKETGTGRRRKAPMQSKTSGIGKRSQKK